MSSVRPALRLVHSVPGPRKTKKQTATLEKRLEDMGELLEEAVERCVELTRKIEELETQNKTLAKRDAELVTQQENLQEWLDETREESEAFEETMKERVLVVVERMRAALGHEHHSEDLPRYELRRAIDDLKEEFR